MKLLCVNDKLIVYHNITIRGIFYDNFRFTGDGLKEGNIYETNAKSFMDEDNFENYYIVGLGGRLKCRFTELLDQTNQESIVDKETKEKLKVQELQLN